MNVLALYTASEPASAALVTAGEARGRELPAGRTLEGLAPLAAELLAERGLPPAELDGVAVAAGPGSFTGLRVGAATGLGLARGAACALFAAGTLDVWAAADAAEQPAHDKMLWIVLDARRGEVYAAGYQLDPTAWEPRLMHGPAVLAPAEAAARVADLPVRVVGDGRPLLEAAGLPLAVPGRIRPETPLALALARLVERAPDRHRCGPRGLSLEYLREPQAVVRRTAGSAPAVSGRR